jgi:hypothetical protein
VCLEFAKLIWCDEQQESAAFYGIVHYILPKPNDMISYNVHAITINIAVHNDSAARSDGGLGRALDAALASERTPVAFSPRYHEPISVSSPSLFSMAEFDPIFDALDLTDPK